MNEPMRILIGYDGSECADAAIDDLRRAGLPKEAVAIVFSVVENWSLWSSGFELTEDMDELIQVQATARRGAARVKSLMPEWEVKSKMGVGSPASAIIEKSEAWNPDFIVVGSHGRTAAGRFFFGSASLKLAHEAHCTVRIARARREEPVRPVLRQNLVTIDIVDFLQPSATLYWYEGITILAVLLFQSLTQRAMQFGS